MFKQSQLSVLRRGLFGRLQCPWRFVTEGPHISQSCSWEICRSPNQQKQKQRFFHRTSVHKAKWPLHFACHHGCFMIYSIIFYRTFFCSIIQCYALLLLWRHWIGVLHTSKATFKQRRESPTGSRLGHIPGFLELLSNWLRFLVLRVLRAAMEKTTRCLVWC